jgi:putative membrane protein
MLETVLTKSISGLPAFLTYFGLSLVYVAVFLRIYTWITPFDEFTLIRKGNPAAAASLCGAMLGFAIPLASAIAHSVGLLDMAIWAVIALVIQLLAFGVSRLIVPKITQDIPDGKVASGVFLGAFALAIGILNAASMTY